jgi:hypothetical protein
MMRNARKEDYMFTIGLILFLFSLVALVVTFIFAVNNMRKGSRALFGAAETAFGKQSSAQPAKPVTALGVYDNHLWSMAALAIAAVMCVAGIVLMIVGRLS